MCDTRSNHLVSLARQGADTWHELKKSVRECDSGRLRTVREELEERGDLGALAFLNRVVEVKVDLKVARTLALNALEEAEAARLEYWEPTPLKIERRRSAHEEV